MQTPQARLRLGDTDVLLLGTIPGFVPDGDRVRQAFEAFLPDAVALGVPPEDLRTLEALAKADPKPELPPPDEATERLLQLLAAFGPTRIPSPDLEAAQSLASAAGLQPQAIDLDDARHADLYTTHVKFRHVVQSNMVKSRLLKKGVEGPDAYALAAAWDEAWTAPKGLARVELEREAHMADRLREAARGKQRVLAIVPASRLPGLLARLQAPPA